MNKVFEIGESIQRGMVARRILDAGLDIKPVITHKFAAQDFEQDFEAIKQGNCSKVVLDFEEI